MLAAALVSVVNVARADELPSRAKVRQAMLDGDHASARAWLSEILAADAPDEDKAVAGDLAVLNDAWEKSGRPRAKRSALTEPMADLGSDPGSWEDAFVTTRDAFASGDYLELARRFHLLAQRAQDAIGRARAAELRDLARAALPRETTPAPEIEFTEKREPPPPKPPPTVWYGWQTLLSDALVGGTIALQFETRADGAALPVIGVSTYLLGAPIIHAAHGQLMTGLADLGLRVVLPVALGGLLAAPQRNSEDRILGGFYGVVTGALLAVAVDAVFLARKEVRGRR